MTDWNQLGQRYNSTTHTTAAYKNKKKNKIKIKKRPPKGMDAKECWAGTAMWRKKMELPMVRLTATIT